MAIMADKVHLPIFHLWDKINSTEVQVRLIYNQQSQATHERIFNQGNTAVYVKARLPARVGLLVPKPRWQLVSKQ